MKKQVILVAIDRTGDNYRYARYEDGKRTDLAQSPDALTAEHVELLRTNPSALLGDD